MEQNTSDGKYNILPRFSEFDARLNKTYLLAAESVRAIADAKIYTTFNDFCDWMETVFGYVLHPLVNQSRLNTMV